MKVIAAGGRERTRVIALVIAPVLYLALMTGRAHAQTWMVGTAKVDITPPAFEATQDAAFFTSVDPIVDATCPRSTFNSPRLWLYEEPYQDTDGSGHFSYPLSGGGGGAPAPEPFCDYNHNGRWDGFYSSGGSEEHIVRIHDPIDVRAVAFSDGSSTAVVASVVAQGIHENYTHEMRDRARQLTGNSALETFVSANHNESSPDTVGIYGGPSEAGVAGLNSGIDEYYMDFVVEQVAQAAKQAVDNLGPATLWVREFTIPAGLQVRLSNNFPTTDDNGLAAAIDPKIRVLQARNATDDPIVTIMNLAAHNQEIGHDGPMPGDVSEDWPGFFHNRLESDLGQGMAMFLVGDNGSEEDPRTVPEVSGDQYAKAQATGEAFADAVASRIGDALTTEIPLGQLVAERMEFFAPIENNLFKAAASARLFGERQAYTGGVPAPEGKDVRTEVGVLDLGPDLQMLANPGEAFPALMLGSPWGIEDAGCDMRPNPPVPTWHARAPHRFQIGLANDLVGYQIPAWAFSAIPGAFTNEPPNDDTCTNDSNDHDPKGHQHKLETEGVGPSESNTMAQNLTTLLDQRPDPKAQIRLGRFVMPDGSVSRFAAGAIGIVVTEGTCTSLAESESTFVALPSVVSAGARVPDVYGGFMDYDGTPQAAPDIMTRGMWAGGTEASPDVRYYVNLYPALTETGACPTPTSTPAASVTTTPTGSATPTGTATPTATATPTGTVTWTPTGLTATPTPTLTIPVPTLTSTATPTLTPALTPTATATPPPQPGCGQTICGAQPATGCRRPVESQRAQLTIKDRTPDGGDRLLWKWLKGAATTRAEFGDPINGTDYELCVYDANAHLVAHACAPAGGTCAGQPCWRSTSTGFKYRDREVGPGGLRNGLQVVLKAGAAGHAKIGVVGKGQTPMVPSLPLAQPVTVQLMNSDGPLCWDAVYSAPALVNQPGRFKDKAD